MSYQADEFRRYFLSRGNKESSANSYNSYLKRIDLALRDNGQIGLDEAIEIDLNRLRNWAKTTTIPPFDKKPSDPRSVLNTYLLFRQEGREIPVDTGESEPEPPLEPTGQAFQLEKEMQAAVRRQIEAIESGLQIVDGGGERSVASGRIDILAKDKDGVTVIIELKAGECPKGAVEQVLAYGNDMRLEEEARTVRMLLIAKSFPDRIVGAANMAPNLELITYDYSLTFKKLE